MGKWKMGQNQKENQIAPPPGFVLDNPPPQGFVLDQPTIAGSARELAKQADPWRLFRQLEIPVVKKTMGNLMGQSQEFVRQMGVQAGLPPASPQQMPGHLAMPSPTAKEVLQSGVGMAKFPLDVAREFAKDPVKMVTEQPLAVLSVLGMLFGLGKGATRVAGKVKGGGLLTTGDLSAAFQDISKQVPDWKPPTPEVVKTVTEVLNTTVKSAKKGRPKAAKPKEAAPTPKAAPIPEIPLPEEEMTLRGRRITPLPPEKWGQPPDIIADLRPEKAAKPARPVPPGGQIAGGYLNEPINYGGEIKARGAVIAEMQKQGIPQKNIDAYMMGAKTVAPILSEAEQVAEAYRKGGVEILPPTETAPGGQGTSFERGPVIKGGKAPPMGMSTKLLTRAEAEAINKQIAARQAGQQAKAPIPEMEQYGDVLELVKGAKPIRKEQEAMYSAERGKRIAAGMGQARSIGGEAGFEAKLAAQSGEMPKVKFEPIGDKIEQGRRNTLFDAIEYHPLLSDWDRLPAGTGLRKMLGGQLPQEHEIIMLNRVFGQKITSALLAKRGKLVNLKEDIIDALNLPRAVMSSYDFSFGFRQGVFLAARYPKEFFSSFAKQFEYWGSDKAFQALRKDIISRPTYQLMMRGRKRLAITEIGSRPGVAEERFMSHFAEKIPGIKMSERAYVGGLNKLRADVFDRLVRDAEKAGHDPWKDYYLTDSIADFVNNATGRGELPAKVAGAATTLNAAFFSPRLMSSRFRLLDPRYYSKWSSLHPFVRKQALKSLLSFAGAGMTILTLAKMGGVEVGTNPFSSDFGKMKIGNTRIDIWGGFQQYIRTAAQFIAGKSVSPTTGQTREERNRLPILSRFLEYKTAPVLSFVIDLTRGKTSFGEDFKLSKEVANRFVPMAVADIYEVMKEDPELIPAAALGMFGFGVQTYKPKSKGYAR